MNAPVVCRSCGTAYNAPYSRSPAGGCILALLGVGLLVASLALLAVMPLLVVLTGALMIGAFKGAKAMMNSTKCPACGADSPVPADSPVAKAIAAGQPPPPEQPKKKPIVDWMNPVP